VVQTFSFFASPKGFFASILAVTGQEKDFATTKETKIAKGDGRTDFA
jgi:hypothetical protein